MRQQTRSNRVKKVCYGGVEEAVVVVVIVVVMLEGFKDK